MSASVAAARITCLKGAAMLRASGRFADATRMQHQVLFSFYKNTINISLRILLFFESGRRAWQQTSRQCWNVFRQSIQTRFIANNDWFGNIIIYLNSFFLYKKTFIVFVLAWSNCIWCCEIVWWNARCLSCIDSTVRFRISLVLICLKFLNSKINCLLFRENLDAHYLCIITGAGNHSPGGKARVRPAIEDQLQQRDLAFRASSAGCLVVKLTKHS